jgi:hypothetical protein
MKQLVPLLSTSSSPWAGTPHTQGLRAAVPVQHRRIWVQAIAAYRCVYSST